MKLHPKLKSEFINVPDRGFGKSKIYTSHGGNGPPLLLIHGNPMCQLTWHKILPDLIKNFYIVAVDIRGYGDSEGPNCLLYTSPSPRDERLSRMPSSA